MGDRRTLAGIGLGVAAIAALALALAGRGGALSPVLGEASQASLTLDVPAAVTNRIYGGANAAGRPIIVIDAGHGGRDPGAVSVSGAVHEKALTLQLATELRDRLVERGRVRVALTREDDRYLTLEERTAVARRLGASLFLSIHADSAPNPLARGATVYSLSDVASDAEAARLSAAQNANGDGAMQLVGQADGSVRAILADLAMRSEMQRSAAFAGRLVKRSAGQFELRPDPHRFAAFHVLKRADTPAVLFEAGYISNADDELLLRSAEHRSAIVQALAQAVEADVASRLKR
ncbi:N-acetylmuramoyl-L-alanine amidase [Sphingomonas lutea]|uniref:N-acetylmuramoyl-L-alanine amidase n=1 Tax=Sphingomonas lutea TaxID=1045317 RepID=A0A7G9SH68_9SPHN|nr:N-acetylmuramoyl-L-alanine amidase [Sphingomonas lutea]QNN67193.1 N-acetylmuramoyl-L-alanine amidase [Sphingomonas lutea]